MKLCSRTLTALPYPSSPFCRFIFCLLRSEAETEAERDGLCACYWHLRGVAWLEIIRGGRACQPPSTRSRLATVVNQLKIGRRRRRGELSKAFFKGAWKRLTLSPTERRASAKKARRRRLLLLVALKCVGMNPPVVLSFIGSFFSLFLRASVCVLTLYTHGHNHTNRPFFQHSRCRCIKVKKPIPTCGCWWIRVDSSNNIPMTFLRTVGDHMPWPGLVLPCRDCVCLN